MRFDRMPDRAGMPAISIGIAARYTALCTFVEVTFSWILKKTLAGNSDIISQRCKGP